MYFMMGKLRVFVGLWNQKRKCGKWRKEAKVSRLLLPTRNESRLPEERNAGARHKSQKFDPRDSYHPTPPYSPCRCSKPPPKSTSHSLQSIYPTDNGPQKL